MADLTEKDANQTGSSPDLRHSETSSATKAAGSDREENVEDAQGPQVTRHTRFPTHDLAHVHDIEKTDSENKIEITEEDCYDELGFSFPTWKKWMILTVIFLVQVSMNFNTSLYSNGLGGISEEFGISEQAARCGAMIFLVL